MAPPAYGSRRRQDVTGLVAGLEPAQRAAVLADDPVVCVLAGAGTGKTRVLTLRVARRVQDRSAHPTHVLVCTFSRKAADELRDRLWTLGVGAELHAGTFHRTALRLIAQHRADHKEAPPTIADRRSLLAVALGRGGPPEGSPSARRGGTQAAHHRTPARVRTDLARLDAEIGWAKARLIGPAQYEEAARRAGRRSSVPAARVAERYAHYEEIRRQRGALDLDDLLWHCGDLLEQDQPFADAVRWWHRHVFVDEMQDLNEAQYRLLRLLVGDEPDLFVVGDPNQSVYGWNGADPALLGRVTEEYAGTRVVRLDTNYRCSSQVVTVASAALGRHDDPPPSARRDGPLPTVTCLPTDAEEARWVARRVWLAHRPGRRWSSIAVLARTNAQLTRLTEALTAERVPHRFAGASLTPASDVTGAGNDQRGAREKAAPDAEDDLDTDDTSEIDDGGDAVMLSTFHRAKGLEWRTVFVIGVSDGLVPLVTARSKAAQDEERRLFYVALTRAEDELACSWALHADDDTAPPASSARRPSPWLAAVERTLEEMRAGSQDAGPARAASQLDRIRALLPPIGASRSTGGMR